MDGGSNLAVTMSDPEISGQFVTRDEFSRHEARLDSKFDEILQLIGEQKTRIQDGATGLDKDGEIATLKAEIGKHKQEKERQRNLLQKREGEIATLKAEIGKHKQEKERQRNLLLSQSLEQEKTMEALRKDGVVMTKELESVKEQQKTLQQEKEKLIAETASLKTQLEQEKSAEEIAIIRAHLEETQQRMMNLEKEVKEAASEESKVREKHEEKLNALDNHLKRLFTNQVHQNLTEERTDIHSPPCSVYDEEILMRIRPVFVQHVNPLNVLHFFHKFNTKILTQHDIEKVTAVTNSNGKFVGAAELLSCLVRYKDWFPCLLQVLHHPVVKMEHVANRMEEILEQDPVVHADTNNVIDEDNEEEHHGTESEEILKLHRHMEVLEIALTTCRNEISQANTDKDEVRDKLDKLENHIQKVETSHSHELGQKEERLASLEKLAQQTQSNMTKEIKDLQKTFKDNIKKTKLEIDSKMDSVDEKVLKIQEQNLATINEQASKLGKVEKKLKKIKEEEQERWSQIDSIHTDVESLKDDQRDNQQLVKIQGLEKHMETLTSQCDSLQDQVGKIEPVIQMSQELAHKISTLATDEQVQELIQTTTATSRSMEELTSKVEDTERSVRGCVAQRERDENRRRETEDRVAVLEERRQQDLDHYTKELEETKSLLDDVVKKVEDISTQLDKHERSVVPARVGFTAYRSGGPVPSPGSRITNFTNVFHNEGNHYNSSSGEFICPVDGLYVVSTTLRQNRDGEVSLNIKRQCSNTTTSSTQVCRAVTSQANTSCCGVAVVRLTHGDRVYVEVYFKEGDPELSFYSSFSCFQIG